MIRYAGWNPEQEESHWQDFSDKCQGSVLQWSNIESRLIEEAANPMTVLIDKAVQSLYTKGKSSYPEYIADWQQTNDCGSWGTCNAVDLTQVFLTYRYIESMVYRTFKPWVYGVAKCLAGDHADNGMSISMALQHITTRGVLPADLPGLPKYSGTLQKQLLKNCTAFYNEWKDKAIMHDVSVVRLPMDFDAWQLWAKTGRMIVYGTTQETRKKGNFFVESGRTSHCEACGGNFDPATGSITKVSSWPDSSGRPEGWGWITPATTKNIIKGGARYGAAFGIWEFTRRDTTPDFSGIGHTS